MCWVKIRMRKKENKENCIWWNYERGDTTWNRLSIWNLDQRKYKSKISVNTNPANSTAFSDDHLSLLTYDLLSSRFKIIVPVSIWNQVFSQTWELPHPMFNIRQLVAEQLSTAANIKWQCTVAKQVRTCSPIHQFFCSIFFSLKFLNFYQLFSFFPNIPNFPNFSPPGCRLSRYSTVW